MIELLANPDLITSENKDKTFKDYPLSPPLLSSLSSLSFFNPTPIQSCVIPPGCQNYSIIAQAKAGTGKTLAYSSILLDKFCRSLRNPEDAHKSIKAIIIVPTRELAIQIHRFLSQILESIPGITVGLSIGGLPIQDIRGNLKRKEIDIIVGTLGRSLALIKEKSLQIKEIETIVLDEADKLLKKENQNQTISLLTILQKECRETPQYLAFSATYTEKELVKLRSMFPAGEKTKEILLCQESQENKGFSLKRQAEISLDNVLKEASFEEKGSDTGKTKNCDLNLAYLSQFYIKIPAVEKAYQKKTETIVFLLKTLSYKQSLVFYNEKSRGEELAEDLKSETFSVCFIHGDQSQSDRIKVMNRLSLNKVSIIITTDLLSRGIDITGIDLVINYDVPHNIETYFHRIGRTGRYGTYGVSILMLFESETAFLEKHKTLLTKIQEITLQNAIEKIGSFAQSKETPKTKKTEKNKKSEGFFFERKLEWKNLNEKLLNEEDFKYFNEEDSKETQKKPSLESKSLEVGEIHNLSCLDCEICKEFLLKTQEIMGESFEILRFFKV